MAAKMGHWYGKTVWQNAASSDAGQSVNHRFFLFVQNVLVAPVNHRHRAMPHELPKRVRVCPRLKGVGSESVSEVVGANLASDPSFLQGAVEGLPDGGHRLAPVVDNVGCAAFIVFGLPLLEDGQHILTNRNLSPLALSLLGGWNGGNLAVKVDPIPSHPEQLGVANTQAEVECEVDRPVNVLGRDLANPLQFFRRGGHELLVIARGAFVAGQVVTGNVLFLCRPIQNRQNDTDLALDRVLFGSLHCTGPFLPVRPCVRLFVGLPQLPLKMLHHGLVYFGNLRVAQDAVEGFQVAQGCILSALRHGLLDKVSEGQPLEVGERGI